MTEFAPVTFKGNSGSKYEFTAYSRDTEFDAVGAIYLMTKRRKKGDTYNHTSLFVGQTGDLSKRPLNHHQKACFDREGANSVCIFQEDTEEKRLKIESDLLHSYDPPCNLE